MLFYKIKIAKFHKNILWLVGYRLDSCVRREPPAFPVRP
ncbi:hypothetical protein WI0192307A01_CDS0004 [Salmonella phage VT223]